MSRTVRRKGGVRTRARGILLIPPLPIVVAAVLVSMLCAWAAREEKKRHEPPARRWTADESRAEVVVNPSQPCKEPVRWTDRIRPGGHWPGSEPHGVVSPVAAAPRSDSTSPGGCGRWHKNSRHGRL